MLSHRSAISKDTRVFVSESMLMVQNLNRAFRETRSVAIGLRHPITSSGNCWATPSSRWPDPRQVCTGFLAVINKIVRASDTVSRRITPFQA